MQQHRQIKQRQINQRKRPWSHALQVARLLYWIRFVLFSAAIVVAVFVALPALLLGGLLWRLASIVHDRREYWRSLWAFAVFCVVVYVVWLVLANPLPDLWLALRVDLTHHLWQLAERPAVLFWLFHLWLAPLVAPILAGLYPDRQALQLVTAQPKVPTLQDELDERGQITRQLARLQDLFAGMKAEARPTAVAPVPVSLARRDYPLGRYERGELIEHVLAGLYRLPASFFAVHGVVMGEPGAGKTITLIKLAAIARAYGRRIIYLDLKGSRRTASLFFAAMSLLGVRTIRFYPGQAYDGWRGDAQALYNRLMQQIDPASHPFYRAGVGSTIVALACKAPPGPPRSSREFLRRLDYQWLRAHYAFDGQALREIEALAPHIGGVALVFSGFFRGIAGGLDGTWAFEDADACYIGINGIAHREEAAALARYLVDDAAHYATARKDPREHALLILDEFGVLQSTNTTALYEQVRESGLCVYASGQSYQSLGRERDNVLAASPVKIVHRCGNPEPLIAYAGKREVFKFSLALDQDDSEDLYHPYANKPDASGGYMRPQEEYAVPIEDVQQLDVGHMVLIDGGKHAYIQVQPLEIPDPLIQAAHDAIVQAGRYQPLPPLPPVPEKEKEREKRAARKKRGQTSAQSESSPAVSPAQDAPKVSKVEEEKPAVQPESPATSQAEALPSSPGAVGEEDDFFN